MIKSFPYFIIAGLVHQRYKTSRLPLPKHQREDSYKGGFLREKAPSALMEPAYEIANFSYSRGKS